MDPLITIVTPCRNAAPYIERAIRSVINEQRVPVEYIIIDGGSTDGTVEIIKKYAGAISYWVSEPDRGQTDALIKGFARASGKIFGWVCADDYLENGALSHVVHAAQTSPDAVAWVGSCRRRSITNSLRNVILPALDGFPDEKLWWRDVRIPQPSCFFSAAAYHKAGGLNPSMSLAMDLELWLRLIKIGKMAIIPEILANACIHDGTRSGSDPALTMCDALTAYCINGHQKIAAELFKHYSRYEYWKQSLSRTMPIKALRKLLGRL